MNKALQTVIVGVKQLLLETEKLHQEEEKKKEGEDAIQAKQEWIRQIIIF